MKKVALISDGWKRMITYAWVAGIMDYINSCEEEICLYQYNCNGNWSKDEHHNTGEYNIYNLPDLTTFDGIIMDCINITDPKRFDSVVQLLRNSSVPVVSIGTDIEDFYYAGIDNKKTICELMEHLYEEHGCRKFVFAGGPAGNFENSLRTEAYLESLAKFGLSEKDNPIWYGDFDFDTGVTYFNSVLEKNLPLPDVFVCANDNIATGLCYTAQQNGYSIPDDFRVTGFDNLDKAIYFDPQITTVGHMREIIGSKCMDILMNVWNGNEIPRRHFIPSSCIFTESCGCPNSGLIDYRKEIVNRLMGDIFKLKSEELLVDLESRMMQCKKYDELFHYIGKYFMDLECDGFAVILDKRLYEGGVQSSFSITGYNWDYMEVAYAGENNKVFDITDPWELFAHMDATAAGNAYMFSPIHFGEYTIGFSILKNGRFLYDNPYFYDIHSTITKTMENMFKKFQLQNANKRLMEIYNKDQLTGLYNRIAYTEMIEPEYEHLCKAGQKCAITFSDADFFKEINDTYGHEKGDNILKKIANALSFHCPEHGYVYRFGGDEFIVFFPCNEEKEILTFRDKVTTSLMTDGISISMGIAMTDPESGKKIDDYVHLADQDMYRIKTAKKKGSDQ